MKNNIEYSTDNLKQYFSTNRIRWDQFYESERQIIGRVRPDEKTTVLDIGCGCGGLGLALKEKSGTGMYTGVDIHRTAIDEARLMNPAAVFHQGDIIELAADELNGAEFDIVFSLSCVDWNVLFDEMLAVAWQFVKPGGHLIATFRLTAGEGCKDFQRSYQYINFDNVMEGEKAAYVVLNARELLTILKKFDVSHIDAFGYWGTPSQTAVTPFEELCFSAFAIRKSVSGTEQPEIRLELPEEIVMEASR